MEATTLGAMRQIAARVLQGHVLGHALIVRHVRAGDVYVRLRRRCVSSWGSRWRLILISCIFSL